jgi:type III secretion protein T
MHPVLQIFETAKYIILALAIASARTTAGLRVSVFFSQQYITGMGRNASIVALNLFLFPLIYPKVRVLTGDIPVYLLMLMKEAVLGIIVGMLGNFIFYVVQSVGFIVDTQRGSTMASVMNPMTEEQTSPLGNFMMFFVMSLCIQMGGFFVFLEGLYGSYAVWPIDRLLPDFDAVLPKFFLDHFVGDFMAQLAALAGPVIFILFLAEFGLGMIARFAPQLNVFFLAMPVKSALAIFFLVLYLPSLVDYFRDKFWSGDKIGLFLKTVAPLILPHE